jgi:hypothetical protein
LFGSSSALRSVKVEWVRGIVGALSDFAAERFPLRVTVPLAVALSAGPYALSGGGSAGFARSVLAVFLVLFVLRIVDDLRSVSVDRLLHPARGLPVGRIAVPALKAGAACLLIAAFAVSAGRPTIPLTLLAAWYAVYFRSERHIPLVLRPWAVNVVFLWIPLHVVLSGGHLDPSAVAPVAAFFWLSAVGHDYLHDVRAATEAPVAPETCGRCLGPRGAVLVGTVCFVGAFVAGAWLGLRGGGVSSAPPLFLASLAVLLPLVGYLAGRLMAHPSRARARPFYVTGFAAFVLPSALLGLDRLLGRWAP